MTSVQIRIDKLQSVMRWCTRGRVRTLCLGLACLSVLLHLLLVMLTLSVYQTPCEPHSQLPSETIRALADPNAAPRTDSHREAPSGLRQPRVSSMDVGGDHQVVAQTREESSALKQSGIVEPLGEMARARPVSSPQPLKPNLTKLEALFQHPLFKPPGPPLQEDDWLLLVKPKVKENELESPHWLSASEEGYDAVHLNNDIETYPPWLRFHLGITRWQLYDPNDPNLRQLEEQLTSHKIVSAVQKTGGTQLKLVMSFPNYGQSLFKPMKQDRDDETNYNLYYFSDFERHNAEIGAYHLDRILGFRRVPPAVGRLVDVITEIKDITTDRKLAKTFFNSPVGNTCFYGQCSYYCSTEHAVCGRPRALEASMATMLPDLSLAPRRSWRSPWRRSYSRSKRAQWETEKDYCDTVKKTPPYNQGTRLVDVIDMAILDFLMSNMDRHHYETFEKFGNITFLIHLDNGRAFGRFSKDEPSILAPLEQCCRVRRSTLMKLQLLALPQYRLSDVMRASLSQDPLTAVAPLLSEPHLVALDRRLARVLKVVGHCQEQYSNVIYNDIPDYP
ncbi:extracellular serine/threonine protein kinase FAM20C isoform X1 [Alosa alosa]|nr:extracellular serine/threonine protein kinase FAM20C isoform X1 [Alosa alosa]